MCSLTRDEHGVTFQRVSWDQTISCHLAPVRLTVSVIKRVSYGLDFRDWVTGKTK